MRIVPRTPGEALCIVAEWNLATVEMLKERKRTSKSDLERAQSIADESVELCKQFATKKGALAVQATRVAEFLPTL